MIFIPLITFVKTNCNISLLVNLLAYLWDKWLTFEIEIDKSKMKKLGDEINIYCAVAAIISI